jgi:hypothetical protein
VGRDGCHGGSQGVDPAVKALRRLGQHAGITHGVGKQRSAYREAAALGVELDGVRVTAAGGFDTGTWRSTGISYVVEVSSDAPAGDLARLLKAVDEVAEIPRAIRAGATVRRVI